MRVTLGLLVWGLTATAVVAQACVVGERTALSAVFDEDFGTGSGRAPDANVLNHTFAPTGTIGDDFYAVGISTDMSSAFARTGGDVDADGAVNGRFLFINMRGRRETPPIWIGEFYRQNSISLLGAAPAGTTVEAFRLSTDLVGTCAGCSDIPNFDLIVEDGSTGAVLASQNSGTIGVVNDDVWRTATALVDPVPSGLTSVNLVLFNSQPEGDNGNDVGVDNIIFEPLVCTPPTMELTKTANEVPTIVGEAGLLEPGDVIRFTFSATNTGVTTAYNVNVVETSFTGAAGTLGTISVVSGGADLDGGNGTPTDVAPGGTITFQADYTVQQTDIDDLATIINQARVDFENLAGTTFSDLSDNGGGDGTDGVDPDGGDDDNSTVLTLTQTTGIEIRKSADTSALSSPFQVDDTITFSFEVENTGNLSLDEVGGSFITSETLNLGADGSGATVSLTSGPGFTGGDTDADGFLDPDEIWTYSATFDLTAAAISAAGLQNTATVSGNPVDEAGSDLPGLTNPSDLSDHDDTGDGTAGVDTSTGGTGDTTGDDNPTSIALPITSSSNFTTDTTNANACTAAGGTLSGGNLFTAFDNGTLGTSPTAAPDNSPTTNPFAPLDLTGATYEDYPDVVFGNWTVVSNLQNGRNGGQIEGIFDPVNGITGRFFHIDPNADTAFPAVNLSGLTAGQSYEVSFWVADAEIDNPNHALVSVEVDGSEAFNTGSIENPVVPTNEMVWFQHAGLVTATGSSASIVIRLQTESGGPITSGSGRDIHFDEIRVQECILPNPALTATKTASVGSPLGDGTFNTTFAITVSNTGNTDLTALTLVDDLTASDQLGAAFNGVVSQPVVTAGTIGAGSTLPDETTGYNGTNALIGGNGVLAPGDSYVVTFTVNVNPGATGAPTTLQNQATAGGTPPSGPAITDLTDNDTTGGSTPGVDTSTGGTGDTTGDDNPTVFTAPSNAPPFFVPFACNDDLYQIYGSSGTLARIDTVNGGFDNIASVGFTMNAIGYREADNFIYGLDNPTNQLVVLDSTGAFSNLGSVTGLPNGNFIHGAFAADGLLHVREVSSATVYRINVDSIAVASTYTLSPNVGNLADYAFDPTSGLFFGITTGASNTLVSISPINGVTTNIAATNIPGGGAFGAAYSDSSGRLLFARNSDGAVFEVDAATGFSAQVATSGSSSSNDGASCPAATFTSAPGSNLTATKSASIGALQTNGTIDVTYAITVQNTGPATLTPMTLVDDLTAANQLGTAFNGVTAPPVVSAGTISAGSTLPTTNGGGYDGSNGLINGTTGTLVPGDSFVVTFTVNVDPNATGAPAVFQNQATAGGTPPSGPAITDLTDNDASSDSTDGVDAAPGGTGNTTGDDNPSVVELVSPGLALLKSADTSALSTPLAVGDTLSFTYMVENTGNVALDEIGGSFISTDTITLGTDGSGATVSLTAGPSFAGGPAAGDTDSDGLLDINETWTYTATFELTQAAIDAGGVQNTATASGNPVDAGGTDIPGATDPTDISDNDATGDGTDGIDTSTGGTGDTSGDSNPTVVTLAPTPGITLAKRADTSGLGTPIQAGDVINFLFTVTNTGNVALDEIGGSFITADTMNLGSDGSGAPVSLDALPAFSGGDANSNGRLDVGEAWSYTAAFTLTQDALNAGGVQNTATASGNPVDESGADIPGLTDPTAISDNDTAGDGTDGVDPTPGDGTTNNNPTSVTLALAPGLQLTKSLSSITDSNGDGFPGFVGDNVTYTFTVENTGNTPIAGITITDDVLGLTDVAVTPDALLPTQTATLGPITYTVTIDDARAGQVVNSADTVGQPVAVGGGGAPDPGTPLINPATGNPFDPVEDTSDAGTEDRPDEFGVIIPVADPPNEDTNSLPGDIDDEPTVFAVPFLATPTTGLVVTKEVTGDNSVILGEAVSYSITATNTNTTTGFGPLNLVDTLPKGLTYIPDTATVNGAPVTPDVSGQVITFSGQILPPATTLTYTLSARVGANAPTGDLVNSVALRDPTSNVPLSNIATASIFRRPEAVFDCSDIIGKVFDDRNFDGYQNDPDFRTGDISDDTAFDGKIASDRFNLDEEPGLPNARVVTPTGTVITTDEYGRFHVPCAELPTRTGMNFSLKLDTRSLPTGYRVTTENPRVMRVTPGILTEMNFGAALGRVIDIDLSAAAFDQTEPVERLEDGIARLLQQMERSPAVLRLSYFQRGEGDRLVRARLDAVEDYIRERWRDSGDYRLIIERNTIVLQ